MIVAASSSAVPSPVEAAQLTQAGIFARAGHWMSIAGGWVAIAVVAAAPWLFGGIRPWASAWISTGGIVAAGLWLAGLGFLRRRPHVSPVCAAFLAGAVLLGWGMTLWPRSSYQGPGVPFAAALTPGAFGSVDARSSREVMLPITAAAGVLLVVASHSRQPAWRRRILVAAVASGAALAGYGLLVRAGAAPGMIDRGQGSPPPFGPFLYHGVAGAYLNLVLPLSLSLAMILALAGRRRAAVAAGAAAMLCLAAGLVNVSKAGMALSIILCLATLLTAVALLMNAGLRVGWKVAVLPFSAVFLLAAFVLALAGGEGRRRWVEFLDAPSLLGGRQIMWRISGAMAADAGAFGYGPGSFKLLLPHTPHFDRELYRNWIVTEYVPGTEVSFWCYACNDYLQGVIEWGWLGAALWTGVIAGGLICAIRCCVEASTPTAERVLLVGVVASIAGLLAHAMIDGPMQVQSIQIWMGALLGLAWGSGKWIAKENDRSCASF